jgi:hypothetical protein
MRLRRILLVTFAAALCGCSGSIVNMRELPEAEGSKLAPRPGEAMVVFMRPSGTGWGVQSSVYEVVDGKPVLVGIVAAKAKVAYAVPPGNRMFMVISESGDFMAADLRENRTYYAQITPRMGFWRSRFSLEPVPKEAVDSESTRDSLAGCRWVAKNADSDRWFNENLPSITEKLEGNLKKWQEKAEADKPRLLPDDGK